LLESHYEEYCRALRLISYSSEFKICELRIDDHLNFEVHWDSSTFDPVDDAIYSCIEYEDFIKLLDPKAKLMEFE